MTDEDRKQRPTAQVRRWRAQWFVASFGVLLLLAIAVAVRSPAGWDLCDVNYSPLNPLEVYGIAAALFILLVWIFRSRLRTIGLALPMLTGIVILLAAFVLSQPAAGTC